MIIIVQIKLCIQGMTYFEMSAANIDPTPGIFHSMYMNHHSGLYRVLLIEDFQSVARVLEDSVNAAILNCMLTTSSTS